MSLLDPSKLVLDVPTLEAVDLGSKFCILKLNVAFGFMWKMVICLCLDAWNIGNLM